MTLELCRQNKLFFWIATHAGMGMSWGMWKAVEDFNVDQKRHLRDTTIWEPLGSSVSENGKKAVEIAACGVSGALTGAVIGATAPVSYPIIAFDQWKIYNDKPEATTWKMST